MPQMSPLMWSIFPLVMMMLVLVNVIVLDMNFYEKLVEGSWVSGEEYFKW